ncbi:porin family protein [Parabacteroides sp. PF5-9]|uniref:porin family protein n=1 Tax=Parabacteroides sp. PF5-9 TaxID=1742404 RepID=UPI0024745CC5|nr:porin family protein [Parabacteroides sp. PF5-9]MDH6358229.1 hypothetical protein [Parabacteroides sp. PF5-9]
MKNNRIQTVLVALLCVAACVATSVKAQDHYNHWEFKVFAGYNMGGTTPFPLPAEIRKINSWNPGFSGTLAFHVTRWLHPQWGITSGLAIDLKGMKIDADVKYWYTNLVVGEGDNTGTFSGLFSGKNKTHVRNDYLVIPLLATYRPWEQWTFRLGGYVASQRNARFDGAASEGYIREGGATGDRINVTQASYDFSDEVRRFDAGLMASADWFFTSKMAVTGQLSWGLVPIFPSSFEGISHKMYNIYFCLGLAYRL